MPLIDATGTIRLFDRMKAEGVYSGDSVEPDALDEYIPPPMQKAERFIIDEVSDLYFTSPEGTWKPSDYVVGLPPFPVTWFEARASKVVNVDGERIPWQEFTAGMGLTMYGGLMAVLPLSELDGDEMRYVRSRVEVPPTATMMVRTRMFIRHHVVKQGNNMVAGSFVHFTDDDGTILPLANGQHWQFGINSKNTELHTLLAHAMACYIDTIMLALNFMACVNVHDQPVHPQPGLAKAFARRHKGQKLDVFRHLIIKPLLYPERMAPGETRPGHGGTGPGKRMHLVRGHFRHMPAIGPSGRRYRKRLFWVRPHVRGDAEYGTVHKTYHIEPRDS